MILRQKILFSLKQHSSWMQLTSTATGNGINTDGLAIGLNTSNVGHVWLRENADLVFATNTRYPTRNIF